MPTAFRAREPSVNFNQCPTIPLAFVFQLPYQLRPPTRLEVTSSLEVAAPPTCISNSCTEFTVFDHVLHRQVLDRNRLVFAYQSSGQLVKKIFTGVSNSCLNPGNLTSCFLSIARAFNSTRKRFLSKAKFGTKTLKVFWVFYLLSVTGSNQRGNSGINAYNLIGLRQRLDTVVINQQGRSVSGGSFPPKTCLDKPTSRCIQFYGYGRWFTTCGERATPPNWQRSNTLCQPQLPISPLESRLSKLCTTSITLLLKVWVFGTSCKKIAESFLQMSQSLLKRYAANLVKELQVFLLFPFSQQRRSFDVVNFLLSFVPAFCSRSQREVVNQADTTQSPTQEQFLFGSGINTKFESAFSHRLQAFDHVSPYITNNVTAVKIAKLTGGKRPTGHAPWSGTETT